MATSSTKKIIIRVIVALFLLSSGLTFVLYFTAPSQPPVDENVPTNVEEYVNIDDVNLVTLTDGEINVDNPEDNDLQIIVTEDEDKDEMDQTVEVAFPDGSVDTPTVGDFSDSLELVQ